METAKPAEVTESDNELHSLALEKAKAEIKSIRYKTLSSKLFALLVTILIIIALHFYTAVRPWYEGFWVLASKDGHNISSSIDTGFNRIDYQMSRMNDRMDGIELKVGGIDQSARGMWQSVDYMGRVIPGQMGDMNHTVRKASPFSMMPW